MVYQIKKNHNDSEYSDLETKEVKPNVRVQIGLSKSRSRSSGRPKGRSFDLSKRRSLTRAIRSESAEPGELISKKTTETKKRSDREPRPLGITVNTTNSISSTERNRSARERTRKDNSVRTRALSMDRPQSRLKRSSNKRRSVSRGRSRGNLASPNQKEKPSTNDEIMYKTQEEKETSMVISSIQPSDSTSGIPTSNDSANNQVDSDILMREKIAKATASSCNAVDSAMLGVESSLANVVFSCSDKLQELMNALPKAPFLFKKDKNSEEKGKDSIVNEKENSQEMVAEKEEREDDEHSREVDVEREMRDDSERDIAYDAVGYSESSNLGVTDKPFMHV